MGGGPQFLSRYGAAPARFRETTVSFPGRYPPGTIVISTTERRLYLVLPNGQALKYGIGVGREGFRWSGVHRITAKKEWPSWTPPSQMLARRPDLPRYMPGGIQNPLGARAMYLGSTLYRIHGSNEPETIGHAVSSGCFRMTNEDVTDLYNRVSRRHHGRRKVTDHAPSLSGNLCTAPRLASPCGQALRARGDCGSVDAMSATSPVLACPVDTRGRVCAGVAFDAVVSPHRDALKCRHRIASAH